MYLANWAHELEWLDDFYNWLALIVMVCKYNNMYYIINSWITLLNPPYGVH